MTNAEIIALIKSTFISSIGGTLSTQQLDKFITTLIDKSEFLKRIRLEKGIATTRNLDRLGIESRKTRKKVEGVDPNVDADASYGVTALTPVKLMLKTKVTYDFLQKAIGGSLDMNPEAGNALENLIHDLVTTQFGNDITDGFFNFDTEETGDDFLKTMDGLVKKISANTGVDRDTYASGDALTDVFTDMLDAMPTEHAKDLTKLRFYVNPKLERAYRRAIAERNTALGDLYLIKNEPVYFESVLVDPIWAFPEDKILLSHDANLALGWGQEAMIERDKDIDAQVIKLNISASIDMNVVIPQACVYRAKE